MVINMDFDYFKSVAEDIRKNAMEHNRLFEESISLIASENLLSPLAKEMMVTDLNSRYAEGLPGDRYYEGNQYVDQIELKAIDLAKKLFNVDFVDLRPISGTVANIAVLKAIAKPGDKIATVSLNNGAHISTAEFGAFGLRGVKPVYMPFDQKEMAIDVDQTRKVILQEKPVSVLFGLSLFLFPAPIKELMDAIKEVNAIPWYDGAHVLGLIAGKKFQKPFEEGISVLSASTHKTFPGPQRGILLANNNDEKFNKKLTSAAFPGVTSNHHLHTLAALGITLAEELVYGEQYANQIIKNAKKLGEELYNKGFNVLCPDKGFTESHTIAIDVSDLGGGEFCAKKLEEGGIIVNKNMLPGNKSAKNPDGLRLGTPEVTRLGFDEDDIEQVADFIYRILKKEGNLKEIKQEIKEFKKGKNHIKYCFYEGMNPYEYIKMV